MSDIYSGITVSEADRGVTLKTEARRYSTGVRRMSDIVGTSSIQQRAGMATMMPNESVFDFAARTAGSSFEATGRRSSVSRYPNTELSAPVWEDRPMLPTARGGAVAAVMSSRSASPERPIERGLSSATPALLLSNPNFERHGSRRSKARVERRARRSEAHAASARWDGRHRPRRAFNAQGRTGRA